MKKFVIGFITGSILFGSIGAFAASGKIIEVFYGIKDIKINNVSQMPADKPFTYNGTTFVPLRYIAEKLGQPVKWSPENQTIYIGKFDGETVYPGNGINFQGLKEENLEFELSYEKSSTKDVLGNSHNKYLLFKYQPTISGTPSGELTFPLNKKYNKFKATVSLTDKAKSIDKPININIYADEKRVYAGVIDSGKLPADIEVNLKDAMNMKISTTFESQKGAELGLFDAHFIKE